MFKLIDSWANSASVFSLLITIVGFVVTILTIWSVKKAVREAVLRVANQGLCHEADLALQFVKETEATCHEKLWLPARFRCVEARNWLSRLRKHPLRDERERSSMIIACDDVGVLIAELDRLCSSSKSVKNPGLKGKRLHEIITLVTELKTRLETQSLEVRIGA